MSRQFCHVSRGGRYDVGNVYLLAVSPQRFQIVELTGFFVEQVDDDAAIIQHDPATFFVAGDAQAAFVEVILQHTVDFRAHGGQLPTAGARCDDEKVKQGCLAG